MLMLPVNLPLKFTYNLSPTLVFWGCKLIYNYFSSYVDCSTAIKWLETLDPTSCYKLTIKGINMKVWQSKVNDFSH